MGIFDSSSDEIQKITGRFGQPKYHDHIFRRSHQQCIGKIGAPIPHYTGIPNKSRDTDHEVEVKESIGRYNEAPPPDRGGPPLNSYFRIQMLSIT